MWAWECVARRMASSLLASSLQKRASLYSGPTPLCLELRLFIERMYLGPPILNGSINSHTTCYQRIRDRFFQAQDYKGDRGCVCVAVKNEVDSICAATILLDMLAKDGIRAFIYPVVDEFWSRGYLSLATQAISEEEWQDLLAKGSSVDGLDRVRSA